MVEALLEERAAALGQPAPTISRRALDLLSRYSWPENITELRNLLHNMSLTASGGKGLVAADIPDYVRSAVANEEDIRIPFGSTMAEAERQIIESTLEACDFRKEECARRLGIGLRTLYRKLKEYEQR